MQMHALVIAILNIKATYGGTCSPDLLCCNANELTQWSRFDSLFKFFFAFESILVDRSH